jgi:hypothetical protein
MIMAVALMALTMQYFISGCAMEKLVVFGFILLLLVITIALFASLYEIKENELTSQRMFFMSTTFLGFVATLYTGCEEGHYISNVVRFY